jgi:uncharacterized membrane protein (DUF106 family)
MLEPLLSLFRYRDPILSLAPLSFLLGIAMLWVFGRVSNQARIQEVKRKARAHMYELRLFADEPSLIWQAQKQLLAANFRLLGLTLRAALVLAVPTILLLLHLEPFYGKSPLPIGSTALVTMQMKGPLDPGVRPALEAPPGVAVETPAVLVMAENQLVWRVRGLAEGSGALRVRLPGGALEKRIEVGRGPRYVSARRESTLAGALWHPGEPRLSGDQVAWIELAYPAANVSWLGMELHWLVWFLVFSMIAALLFKSRLGVTF